MNIKLSQRCQDCRSTLYLNEADIKKLKLSTIAKRRGKIVKCPFCRTSMFVEITL